MITLAAQIAVAAALMPTQAPVVRVQQWLDDLPAQVGLLGCKRQPPATLWKCTGFVPLPESVAAAAASGTTSMGGGKHGHGHGRHHSRDFD
jgi:hypothetical protein